MDEFEGAVEEVRARYLALPPEAQMPELLADYETHENILTMSSGHVFYNYRLSLDMKCIVK